MAWAKVDDELHTNEKFASISLAATGLWTLCLSWTCHQLKDGFVPAGIVRRFAGGDCTAVTELVEAGLWEEVPGGYQFHDYKQHVISRDYYRSGWDSLRAELTPLVFARDEHCCVYCGATEDLTVDHVLPLSRGGTNDLGNLVTACRPCNSSKNAKTPEEWRAVR